MRPQNRSALSKNKKITIPFPLHLRQFTLTHLRKDIKQLLTGTTNPNYGTSMIPETHPQIQELNLKIQSLNSEVENLKSENSQLKEVASMIDNMINFAQNNDALLKRKKVLQKKKNMLRIEIQK